MIYCLRYNLVVRFFFSLLWSLACDGFGKVVGNIVRVSQNRSIFTLNIFSVHFSFYVSLNFGGFSEFKVLFAS